MMETVFTRAMTNTAATSTPTIAMNLPSYCAHCDAPLSVAGATSIAAAIRHARVSKGCTGETVRR